MLKKYESEASDDTPYVIFDPFTGNCKITGKSYPEDIASFYLPIITWWEDYKEFGRRDIVLDMKLGYFNSGSSKSFIDIFERLDDLDEVEVLVNWYYPTDDEEIFESGKIYDDLTDFKFNFIEY